MTKTSTTYNPYMQYRCHAESSYAKGYKCWRWLGADGICPDHKIPAGPDGPKIGRALLSFALPADRPKG